MTNGDNIIKLLDSYMEELSKIRDEIAEKNHTRVFDFFDSAKNYRDSFDGTSSGAHNLLHLLFVDIEDHPGMPSMPSASRTSASRTTVSIRKVPCASSFTPSRI